MDGYGRMDHISVVCLSFCLSQLMYWPALTCYLKDCHLLNAEKLDTHDSH